MRQTFMHTWKGYLTVRMRGFTPERFLNLCRSNDIEIWDICCGEQCHEFKASLADYWRVRPLVRKSQVHLDIIRKHGLPFFLHRNRKRKLYGVGVVSFFLVLFVMTRFIWDIQIDDNYHFTDDTLLHFLSSRDIVYGMPKHKVDCDQLEEDIRSAYPEILWVSARISGTRLLIRVKENDVVGVLPERMEEPADLAADKDGVITSILVRKGKAQVKAGDEVKKGQILVSGSVPIYDDAGVVVSEQRVHADADITARTESVLRSTFPKLTEEREDTGRVRNGMEVRVGGRSFVWLLPPFGEEAWRVGKEVRQVTLFGDFYLPVWVNRIRACEYQKYERSRTKEELEQERERFMSLTEQNLEQKGVAIIENDVKILDKGAYYEICGNYVLEEKIGEAQKMTETKGEIPAE